MRIGLVLLLAAAPAFGASADDYLTIRATPGLPNEVIEYIAKNSQPKSVFIPRGELPSDFVKAVCGTLTKTYSAIFFGPTSMNPKLSSDAAVINRRVLLPACAKWRRDDSGNGLPYGVLPGETLDSILLQQIGRKANQTYKCGPEDASLPNCGLTFRQLVEKLNRGVDLANLIPGNGIRLPFATEATTFQIRRNSPLDVKAHIAKIQDLSKFSDPDSALIQIEEAPVVSMIKPKSNDADPACLPRPRPWPYDDAMVASVIRRTLPEVQDPTPSILTIMDTGLDASFPQALLRRSDLMDTKSSPYGFGIYRPEGIRPDPNQMPEEVRLHGTRVARIAAGFPSLQRAYPELSKLVKLNVVNIAEPPAQDAANQGDFVINTGGLNRAMEWFTLNGDILNISIASKAELPSLQTAIKLHPALLVVVAAGNENDDLNASPWFPANYGGQNEDSGTQFVTVAAYNGSLAPATFTNISNVYVDLFAPGCDVPYDQSAPGVTGTSFAAPLVSMTAALLRSFGFKSPKEIKRRLRASVDYDNNLAAQAAWSGRLNIPKALSIYDDVLQLNSKGGALEFGRWNMPSDICMSLALPPDKVRKITVSKAENPVEIRVLWSDATDQLQEELCEPASDSLVLGGRPDPVPWKDLMDFVPRRAH
jgi:Subtilase family